MRNLNKTFISVRVEIFLFLIVIAISVSLLATQYYKYAILPGLITLFLFLIARFPQFGFYLFVFLIPFHAYRGLSETYQFLRIHWFLAFWLLIVMLFQLLIKKMIPVRLKSNLWPWFLIFFVINLITALMSEYYLTSFTNLFLLSAAYLFIAISLFFISLEDYYKTLPLIIVVSISISTLLGIIGYKFNIPLFSQTITMPGAYKRSFGTSTDPNDLSLMIIFALPILVHFFFTAKSFFKKNLTFILIIINIIGVMLTFSRGGALILSLILILLFIKYMYKSSPIYLGFAVLLVAIIILIPSIISPSLYWSRIRSVADTKREDSIARRVAYLYVALDAFKKNPIFGTGPRTFRDIYARSKYAPQYDGEMSRRYAHNTYIEILIGTGTLGLIVFCVIIWLALKNFQLAKKKYQLYGDKYMASIIGAYQLSFISVLLYFFIYSMMYHKYFLLSLALSQIALRLSQEMPESVVEHSEHTNVNK